MWLSKVMRLERNGRGLAVGTPPVVHEERGQAALPNLRDARTCLVGTRLKGIHTNSKTIELNQLRVRKGGFGTPAEMLGRGPRCPALRTRQSTLLKES
jgi:hypothetical protein